MPSPLFADLSPTPFELDEGQRAQWLPHLINLDLWARTEPFRAEDLVIDPMWDSAPPDVFEAAWCTLLTMKYPNDHLLNALLNTTRIDDPRTGVPLNRGARVAIANGPSLWPLLVSTERSSPSDPVHFDRWSFQNTVVECVFNALYALAPIRVQSDVPLWLHAIGVSNRLPNLKAMEDELLSCNWGQRLISRLPDWSNPDVPINQRMFAAAVLVLASNTDQKELLSAALPSINLTNGYPIHLSLQYGTLQGLEAICEHITPDQVAQVWSTWGETVVKDQKSLDRLLHHVPHLDTDVVQSALAFRFLESVDQPEVCLTMWPHTNLARLQVSDEQQWGSRRDFDADTKAVIEMCQTKEILQSAVHPTPPSSPKRM